MRIGRTPADHSPSSICDVWDGVVGLAACLISFGVYAWTTAPSVTLLDSGEFLVAAQHFGVPHPTGYPLWTFLAWLFSLLPLGNDAWEINLLSGVLGALAVGLTAGLSRSSLRWLFPDLHQKLPGLITLSSLSAALLFAFSFSMWSQAVITEVYTLHALLVAGFLTALYAWIRKPLSEGRLGITFFLLTLAFSNHQLTICLIPLPLAAILLIRREIFWDVVLAGLFTAAGFYLLMGKLSGDAMVWKATVRFAIFTGVVLLVFLPRRKLRGPRYFVILPAAVVAGLLPYGYLPLASSTNPPMNWGYTREPTGLFHTFNRSQYPGPLTEQSLRVVGRLMGVPAKSDFAPAPIRDRHAPPERSQMELLGEWIRFFFLQLLRSFTAAGLAAYLASFSLLFLWRNRPKLAWGILLQCAFLLAALLQPALDKAQTDLSGWWLQMPYHTYTNLLFALLCAAGFVRLLSALLLRCPALKPAIWLLPLLSLSPLLTNFSECSQRGHWFGWMYGHDMLRDLPRGSVLIGGTDPGRFIPTYMIFGESPQKARHKKDPAFDRRDLFVITQNALGDPQYMKYLRDQYTSERPPVTNAFETWLGRKSAYPTDTLILPDEEQVREAIEEASKPIPPDGRPLESDFSILPFSAVLHWIWLKNRDWRDFFIEESFPIAWTYDYAIPWGLVYKLAPNKLDQIPRDAVERDFAFWKDYKNRLLSDPDFLVDIDARRSFSRLRCTTGNIYRHRKMHSEAETAYREALELWPCEPGVIHALAQLLWERGAFDQAAILCDSALAQDPRNEALQGLMSLVARRREKQEVIEKLTARLTRNPLDRGSLKGLIMLLSSVGESDKANDLLLHGYKQFGEDPDFLRFAAAHDVLNGQPLNSLAPALQLKEIEPENPANLFILAHAWYFHTNYPEFFKTMQEAIRLGGIPVREMFQSDPLFAPIREHEEFRRKDLPTP